MAPALGPEIYARGFRFSPTPQEAVTYYLPRLISGDPRALHEVVRPVIRRADVYACEPANLARRFRPMPRTHDRFFFTVIKKGVRAAGPGSWAGQSTSEIMDKKKGVQIGELRKFRYKKRGGVFTDWLMEEYSSSCGLGGAVGGGGGDMQPVLCKVYVSPKAAPNSDAYKESAACFATPPPPAAPAVITQPVAAKRPAPPQYAMPPCAKRMRGPAVQPAPPPRPPAPPAPTLSSLTAVRKMPFAPPQPSAPRRGSTTPLATQPSPASALPPAPPAPTRPHLAAVRKMSFVPPQPCPPHRGLTTPSATRSLPASSRPPAPPAPSHPAVQPRGSPMPLPTPPRPLAQPKQQQVSLPTPPVTSASHMPQQALASPCPPQVFVQQKQRRTVLDPFEAAMLSERAEAEEQTVAAAPAKLQDDDDDFAKVIDDMLSADAEEQTVAAAPAKLQDDDDDFAKVIDDTLSADAEEQTVAAAPAKLQEDDDDMAKVTEDMLSADAEEPVLEFDVNAFFNFSEEDLEASMPALSLPCHQGLILA